MNTREKATKNIEEFLKSDEKCMLLTGTHQIEKHKLILQVINRSVLVKSRILFRVNALNNVESIFQNSRLKVKAGEPKKLGRHIMYIDSINRATWDKVEKNIDYVIAYPLDSISGCSNREEIIENLLQTKGLKKLFLVSWVDVQDNTWLENIIDRKVVFDCEEEKPGQHKRILDLRNTKRI